LSTTRAIYPGSFDPVTNGHLDVIQRASSLFDELIVGISVNIEKNPMFTLDERLEMLTESCRPFDNVVVDSFDGMLVRYAETRNCKAIVKGLRAISDFEFEFVMALMNRKMDPSIETVFMMTSAEYSYISSSIVKEVAGLGGDIEGLVPSIVMEYLGKRLTER